MHFFTSVTACYIPKARVLAKTLKEHNEDAVMHLVISDDLPAVFQGAQFIVHDAPRRRGRSRAVRSEQDAVLIQHIADGRKGIENADVRIEIDKPVQPQLSDDAYEIGRAHV